MNPAMSQPLTAAPAASARFAFLDMARGVALLAMFVFHFAYDLSHFQLIDVDVPFDPGWRLFARMIAGSFLTIVGASLVLATRNGLNRKAYFKRLAMIAGAAALVTVGTRFAMPENFIFFGILHHIALASVLGLAFLRLPPPILIACAALTLALPSFVAHPWLDEPWAVWLGFSRAPLYTADFVPVFPWFGCVLAGMALMKLALPRLASSRFAHWRPAWLPTRIVGWGGRHSLPVYLLHQPIFFALIMLAMQVGLAYAPEERLFLTSCQRSCAESQAVCERFCACTAVSLKRTDDLWRKVLANNLTAAEADRVSDLARTCLRAEP